MLIYLLHDLIGSSPNQNPKQVNSCRGEADLRTHLLQELREEFRGSSSSTGDVSISCTVLALPPEGTCLALALLMIIDDGQGL